MEAGVTFARKLRRAMARSAASQRTSGARGRGDPASRFPRNKGAGLDASNATSASVPLH